MAETQHFDSLQSLGAENMAFFQRWIDQAKAESEMPEVDQCPVHEDMRDCDELC